MIRADLITDNSSRASSMRRGEKTCLYPRTTSIAVRTSRAPHTQKYCPLVSSCFATSCIFGSSRSVIPEADVVCPPKDFCNASGYEILVDIRYTNGKMNIHTRSTKCQYKPQTST